MAALDFIDPDREMAPKTLEPCLSPTSSRVCISGLGADRVSGVKGGPIHLPDTECYLCPTWNHSEGPQP